MKSKLLSCHSDPIRAILNGSPRLLQAVSAEEDAVILLQTAAKACIPVKPQQTAALGDDFEPYFPVPEPKDRPSIQEVLNDIMLQHWYKDQIGTQMTFQAKDGHTGLFQLIAYFSLSPFF